MADQQPRYWQSLEERDGGAAFLRAAEPEFRKALDVAQTPVSRRGFLKAAGFTLTGTVLSGCTQAPVQKAIPYLVQPETIVPGRAYWYASTCAGCSACCGLLVKNRDGRPIKLEGNPQHPCSRGGLCAVGQASILGLYDSHRLQQPIAAGKQTDWPEVDRAIAEQLVRIQREGGAVRFLTSTITSPTTRGAIERFLSGYADARHIVYDSLSCSAILDAHQHTHGARILPRYRFEQADVIVGFDADFLGTWISPVEYAAGWRVGRIQEGETPRCSYHVQFESRMSLTASKADRRIRVAPAEVGRALAYLAASIARHTGTPIGPVQTPSSMSGVSADVIDELAQRLLQARGRSLVVCGSQEIAAQVWCNYVNHSLDNYGTTVDLERPAYQRQGNDRALTELLGELNNRKVAALFICGANPVYELPTGDTLAQAIRKVPLSVSFAERLDETAAMVQYVCPDHHALESWGDAEATEGVVGMLQPAIAPLGNTRAVLESLATWSGAPRPAYEILRDAWRERVFPRFAGGGTFEAFWDQAVHNGFVQVTPRRVAIHSFKADAVAELTPSQSQPPEALALVLYPTVGLLDGRHAYNPWLQELPDPITKVTWDNYASLSPVAAERLGVKQDDVVQLQAAGNGEASEAIELPVVVQPGQHDQVVAVALGYGSEETRRFADLGPKWLEGRPTTGSNGLVGTNAAPLLRFDEGALRYAGRPVRLLRTRKTHPLASTQSHHTITEPEWLRPPGSERRPIIHETTPAKATDEFASGSREAKKSREDLWPSDHPYTGHRWAMVIDLTTCTGCSACVVACQVENNIPVVGKDEVRRRRNMHWLRIDRYYSENEGEIDVAHQPMLCQHCENAPCETVCPVLATVHSEDGLNQQIYNRCVGTRYCANNCPYKVRRFNWFNYPQSDLRQNLVLNPDVTVRTRGVMEKCSFCVQRIQAARLESKQQGAALKDGDVQTACQQSCPAGAIVFGDMNDPNSAVSKLIRSGRHYRVLEEINVRPVVGYLSLVRNRPARGGRENHG